MTKYAGSSDMFEGLSARNISVTGTLFSRRSCSAYLVYGTSEHALKEHSALATATFACGGQSYGRLVTVVAATYLTLRLTEAFHF